MQPVHRYQVRETQVTYREWKQGSWSCSPCPAWHRLGVQAASEIWLGLGDHWFWHPYLCLLPDLCSHSTEHTAFANNPAASWKPGRQLLLFSALVSRVLKLYLLKTAKAFLRWNHNHFLSTHWLHWEHLHYFAFRQIRLLLLVNRALHTHC